MFSQIISHTYYLTSVNEDGVSCQSCGAEVERVSDCVDLLGLGAMTGGFFFEVWPFVVTIGGLLGRSDYYFDLAEEGGREERRGVRQREEE